MPYNVGEIIAAVTRFFQENLPLHTNQEIDIDAHILVRGERRRFHLFVPSLRRGKSVPVESDEEREANHNKPLVHPCITAILAVLRSAGRPLTGTNLYNALVKYWREQRLPAYSEPTVKNYLKILMDDETIENPHGARPAGYRLTDQESTSGTSPAGQ